MSTPTIENIIVVMLENRSYDNILDGLYLNSNGAPYNTPPSGQSNLNGLANSSGDPGYYSNPYAASSSSSLTSEPPIPINNQTAPTQLGGAGTYYPATTIPVVDPGEQFSDMAYQIMGSAQSSNPYGGTWPPDTREFLRHLRPHIDHRHRLGLLHHERQPAESSVREFAYGEGRSRSESLRPA